MKVTRALASAALTGLVLVALVVPAASAADDEPNSGFVSTPNCYNYGDLFQPTHGRCKVERQFKPGKLGKNWSKVTFPYAIWVNDVEEHSGELTITGKSKPDSNGFYSNSDTVVPLGAATPFKLCDTIEIVWGNATVTWNGEVVHKFLGGSGKGKFGGDDCSVNGEEETVSATLPGGGGALPG
jgi:hypothetical protein